MFPWTSGRVLCASFSSALLLSICCSPLRTYLIQQQKTKQKIVRDIYCLNYAFTYKPPTNLCLFKTSNTISVQQVHVYFLKDSQAIKNAFPPLFLSVSGIAGGKKSRSSISRLVEYARHPWSSLSALVYKIGYTLANPPGLNNWWLFLFPTTVVPELVGYSGAKKTPCIELENINWIRRMRLVQ